MKPNQLPLLFVLIAMLLAACAPAATPEPIPPTPTAIPEWDLPGWTLVWQDEFDGPEIDRTKWTFDIGGHGWGNNELANLH
jgi:hypothetical protein